MGSARLPWFRFCTRPAAGISSWRICRRRWRSAKLAPGSLVGVLNGLIPGSEAAYVAHGLTPVLGSLAEIDAWASQARRIGKMLPAILHIDTGMSRLGTGRAGPRRPARRSLRAWTA